MGSRKRNPVAEVCAEEYLIVKHTHDVELARRLMAAALTHDDGCPAWDDWPQQQQHTCTDECIEVALKHWEVKLGRPELRYVRQQYALDSSYAAAEGWAYAYHEYDERGRGRFPAVVFRV